MIKLGLFVYPFDVLTTYILKLNAIAGHQIYSWPKYIEFCEFKPLLENYSQLHKINQKTCKILVLIDAIRSKYIIGGLLPVFWAHM